jgi:hypothetical protein
MIQTMRRHRRPASPPLDLRFIDLFMALILALVFLALLLMIVAGSVPSGSPESLDPIGKLRDLQGQLQEAQGQLKEAQGRIGQLNADNNRLQGIVGNLTDLKGQTEELQGQLADARARAGKLQAENSRLIGQAERLRTALRVPWWLWCLLLANVIVSLLALISWILIRMQRSRKGLLRQVLWPVAWLIVVTIAAYFIRLWLRIPDDIGFVLSVPWWAVALLGLGQLLGLRYVWIILKNRFRHYRLLRNDKDIEWVVVPLKQS